ncbi:MAG: CAP domain-containing protein [Mariniphaga sp.]
MKTSVTLLLILFFQVSLAIIPKNPTLSGWEIHALNTAAEAKYLSSLEKEIILEINKLRTNPKRYAEDYIAPLAKKYNRRLLYYPGDQPLLTREGVNALYECVRDLKRQQPLSIIYPSEGLTRAARDHVNDQSRTGRTGHQGADRSTMRNRVERYGTWEKRIAENIAYGGKTARQIVIYLLIDDGVRDRGHRKNFLNPDFNVVGVATGSHPEYRFMSVMDFAGGFKTTQK